MVKKIKVVEINQPTTDTEAQPASPDPEPTQTVEEPVQTEEAPPKKVREARQPREPRAPKQPKESKVPDPPVEDPPSDADSINTEELMTVISEHRKKKLAPEPVAQEPPPSVCKEDLKVSCPDCKKDMSAKSLKYSHAKNCKAKPAPPPPPPPPEPKKRAPRPKKPQVVEETQEQYLQREVVPTVQQLILAERAMRQGVRKQKFQALLSDAFHS